MKMKHFVGVAASAGALLLGSIAQAQGEPAAGGAGAAEADQHFQHAVELMKADNCTEAVPEFLTSQSLDPSAATLVNLATCQARLGRSATAWKTYQQAATLAATEKNEPLRERALQAMSILGPTLTKLQIVSNPATPPLSIRVNGEVLSAYDGRPIPLDPGESVIEAAAPGREPWRKSVTADDLGATIVIEVPDLRPVPPASQQAKPVYLAERPHDRVDGRTDLRLPAAVLGGAGVASIVVGAIFGAGAQSNYDDSKLYCRANHCTPQGIDLYDRASEKATVSTVTIGLGLVAVTAGVVLWLTSGPSRPAEPSHRATLRATQVMTADGLVMGVETMR
jgi:serine/threonine-protein kinase